MTYYDDGYAAGFSAARVAYCPELDRLRATEARLRAALKEAGNRADDIGAIHLSAFIDAALACEQQAKQTPPSPDFSVPPHPLPKS